MNKVMLIGNLTRNPEYSETKSGIGVCRFSIAVGRNYTDSNGERETDFFNITAWRTLGENAYKYLSKGKKVCVVGSIQNGVYTDREGIERRKVDIVATDIEYLSPMDREEGLKPDTIPKPKKKTVEELTPVEWRDLPF